MNIITHAFRYFYGFIKFYMQNALLDITDQSVIQRVLGIVKTTNNVITLMEHVTTDVKMGILDQTVQKVFEYFIFTINALRHK